MKLGGRGRIYNASDRGTQALKKIGGSPDSGGGWSPGRQTGIHGQGGREGVLIGELAGNWAYQLRK